MSNETPVIECSTCGSVVSMDMFGHLYCANSDCNNSNFVNDGIKYLTEAGFEIAWRTIE